MVNSYGHECLDRLIALSGYSGLKSETILCHPTGSSYICNPPVTNTDEDFVLYVPHKKRNVFVQMLYEDGWSILGSEVCDEFNDNPEDERFNSYLMDRVNIIVTYSPSFYTRFVAATSVAKLFNLLEKRDRIALFQAVLYGNAYNDKL